eukprot:4226630-Pleurochrysis_carterae.AAC.1
MKRHGSCLVRNCPAYTAVLEQGCSTNVLIVVCLALITTITARTRVWPCSESASLCGPAAFRMPTSHCLIILPAFLQDGHNLEELAVQFGWQLPVCSILNS